MTKQSGKIPPKSTPTRTAVKRTLTRISAANRAASRPSPNPASFPIVGIGASAGGLEAFLDLLRHLPADTGMAFVLVQHLDPQHESALTHLLARATSMSVREVTQNLRVEPNAVYVIPPNVQMAIEGGVLKLTPRGNVRGATLSIDFFFKALAHDQRERAIGVVLSGTASDGTLGLEAIKTEGGVTFAQDESAKYDSMPRSAIAAGCVDAVLAPPAIAAELARIAKHPLVLHAEGVVLPAERGPAHAMHAGAKRQADQREAPDAPLAPGGHGTPRTGARKARREATGEPAAADDPFKRILLILRNHCGVDFSLYKSNTIQRRVARRAVLNGHETLADYAALLKGNAKELDALFSDVLISVTSFFRNPEAFDALKRKVFPKLLAQRSSDEPVRVWVLGCSTGQEAYSLAMTFAECAAADTRSVKLQIFATDLNEALLDRARHGLYAKSLVQDISPQRLRRFFVEEDGGYRVTKMLREQVVFARQNAMSDPPFSRMDLITCRNLLIYLEPELQKKIFPAFHYALKPGGFLFLGASESIGQFAELFAPADKKQKIFSRKTGPTPAFRLLLPAVRTPQAAPGQRANPPSTHEQTLPDAVGGEFQAQREADRISVSQFAPPGVLINAQGQVLQFRGATGAYLEPPTGKASFDVLKMAREGLMLPLRAAINRAKREQKPVRREGLRVGHNGGTRAVSLQIIPLRNLKEPCFLILFEDAAASSTAQAPVRAPPPPASKREVASRITELERELAETRDYLQSIQEQNEAANEELQASSEEVQSANEELQSINEELETSKEELESGNEELTTINDEMVSRNTELNRTNADLKNVQVSIQTAILLLSRDLTIRRFTPPAEKIFNLLATDVGRGLGGIRHNLDVPDLQRMLAEVIDTVSLREREVRDKEGRWYLLRARPYLSLDNTIDGVVLVVSDIDALKRTELDVETARNYAEAVLRLVPVPFLVLRADLSVTTASEAFYENFKVTREMTEGRLVYEIGNGQWNIPKLRELLEEIIPEKKVFNGFEVVHEFAQIGQRTMLLNARRVESVPECILLSIEDVTEFKHADAARMRLAAIVESSDDAIIGNDLNGIITSWNHGAERHFGYTEAEAVGRSITMLIPPGLRDEETGILENIRRGDAVTPFETMRQRKDGTSLDVSLTVSPLVDAHGTIVGASKIARDITERKRAEVALRENATLFSKLIEHAPTGVYVVNAQFEIIQVNRFAAPVFSTIDKVIGRDLTDVLTHLWGAELGARFAAIFRHTLETGERYVSPKFAERRHDLGVEEAYEWETHRLVLAPGQYAVVCYFYDVTERDRGERVLRESEERMRLATEATAVGIWEWNVLTDRIRWDGEMFRMYGITPTPDGFVHYSDWSRCVLPEDLPEQERFLQRTVREDDGNRRDFRIRRRDNGECRHIQAVETTRTNAQGSVEWMLGTNLDVTDRKEMEATLQDAARRKDEFLATLAHELRNPLAPIRNGLHLLRVADKDSATAAKVQTMMERQLHHMVRLVDDLLDVSRITSGKIDLRTERMALSAAVSSAVETSRPLIEEMSHALTVTLPRQPVIVQGDLTRLAQVFTNLLNNAAKYSNRGGQITLAVERDGGDVLVFVRDTGIGIAAEQMPHIFTMFSQVERSLDRSRGGLGIGLSLAKRLVEMHGGTIEATSAGLGKGSEFVVRLPVVMETSVPPRPVLDDASPPAQPSLRILVVDDNRDGADSLSTALGLMGNDLRTAYDGEQAVAVAAAFGPQVVLLDLGLPKLNGYDACRRIRAAAGGEAPVLIAVTGWGADQDRRRSQEAGFDHHLVKPVEPAALMQMLTRLSLERSGQAGL